MSHEKIVSISFLIKIIFLIIFIVFTIYLFYMENKIMEDNNKELESDINNNKQKDYLVLESSSLGRKLVKDLLFVYLPALGGYYSISIYLSRENKNLNNQEKRQLEELRENIPKLKEHINKLEDMSVIEKAKYSSMAGDISEYAKQVLLKSNKKSELLSELEKINKLEGKQAKGELLSKEESNLISSKESINSDINYNEQELIKNIQKIDYLSNEIKKSSIVNIDFDFKGFMEGLSDEEKLALCGLLFNNLILSYTISIIVILYGDYLIRRFDLVNKYPKIAKFIQMRQKLQQYYLKISFVWIFMCVFPQIAMYIYILMPKLLELFS